MEEKEQDKQKIADEIFTKFLKNEIDSDEFHRLIKEYGLDYTFAQKSTVLARSASAG